MNYKNFYSDIIKAPMTLQMRRSFAEVLAKEKRNSNHLEWEKISTKKDQFAKTLNQLNINGFARIELSKAAKLAEDLRNLRHDPPNSKSVSETVHLANIEKLSIVEEIKNNTDLHSLVSIYLNAPAHLHSTQAWWQYPMDDDRKASNAQRWHRDRDDFREIKLFFYATDVDNASGPHGFIPGSHDSNKLPLIFNSQPKNDSLISGETHTMLTDKQLKNLGLSVQPHIWLGKAGTCFLEDTSGFHKACIPTHAPRLIFSMIWTIGDGWISANRD